MSRTVELRVYIAVSGIMLSYGAIVPPVRGQVQVAKLPSTASFDGFGWSVAIEGDWAVAGAPFRDMVDGVPPDFLDVGAAYVFRREGEAWVFDTKLTAPDGACADRWPASRLRRIA
jgi:hypothetical protein